MKTKCQCSRGICDWDVPGMSCLPNFTTTVSTSPETECPALEDDNGEWECDQEFKSGSKCKLECKDGWEQLRTVVRCKCEFGICEWLRPIRKCEPETSFVATTHPVPSGGVCPAIEKKAFGTFHCTDGANVGSRCKMECDPGYVVNSRHKARRCRCSNRKQVI